MYFDGTAIRHRLSSNQQISFTNTMWPYISTHDISPDMYIGINFDPNNDRHSSENKYAIDLDFSDHATHMLQYDSGVYGACMEAIQLMGGSSGKVFQGGNVVDISSNCKWNSFVDHPVPLDPAQKQYMFYVRRNSYG